MRLLLVFLSVVLTARTLPAAPPNIVMIISDDQSWTDYSFIGHKQIETPSIDRLAKESRTFTRGYVPDSLCRPSLVTLVTGLYPHQHGVVGNDPPPPTELANASKGVQRRDPRYLQIRNEYLKHIDNNPCVAELLKAKGYVSHQSGKWWEGHFSKGGFTHGMTHGDRSKGGRHGDEGLKIGRTGLTPVFDFMDQAQKNEKPFFVYYAPFLPHTPHNPPQRLLDKYKQRTPSVPIAKYWAMCEWFDETVGDLVGYIDDKKLAENTIILYVTDNGWINQVNRSSYAPRSKRSQYEGGVRTPIMVRWKGRVKPVMDTQNLANSIDLVPTILAAAGLQPTKDMQGIDLLDDEAVTARKRTFGEILEHDIQHMTDPVPSLRFRWVIEGKWKLIVPHKQRVPDAKVELFDVLADPHETKNLAAGNANVVKRLSGEINNWWPAKPAS